MGLNIHTNHRMLFFIPAVTYLVLVYLCAVWPAMAEMEAMQAVPKPIEDELPALGRKLYASYNCVTCHTQQIRGDERKATDVDGVRTTPVLTADARFGRELATRAEEYAWQDPVFMGTQRTGPDLSSTGRRLPAVQWHYWHLYNPQAVSPGSLMPPHRFLFTTTQPPQEQEFDYEEVQVIEGLGVDGDRLWATPDAKALVEYLLSLKREYLEQGRLAK